MRVVYSYGSYILSEVSTLSSALMLAQSSIKNFQPILCSLYWSSFLLSFRNWGSRIHTMRRGGLLYFAGYTESITPKLGIHFYRFMEFVHGLMLKINTNCVLGKGFVPTIKPKLPSRHPKLGLTGRVALYCNMRWVMKSIEWMIHNWRYLPHTVSATCIWFNTNLTGTDSSNIPTHI
jgi:hypothetical protein